MIVITLGMLLYVKHKYLIPSGLSQVKYVQTIGVVTRFGIQTPKLAIPCEIYLLAKSIETVLFGL